MDKDKLIEKLLLEIAVDVEKELKHQCRQCNCDDLQTDHLIENVGELFNLNQQKYIRILTSLTAPVPDGKVTGLTEDEEEERVDLLQRQANKRRWLSQAEFERLAELNKKMLR